MSLDFDLTRLDPDTRASVFPPDEAGLMNDALHVLIWISIPVGIDRITEETMFEFWTRTQIWQRAIGSGFTRILPDSDPEPFVLEARHVKAAVGLRTNVARKSRTEFMRDLWSATLRTFPLDD